MSDYSLTIVLQFKKSKKIINGMAKLQLYYEISTHFGGLFLSRWLFSLCVSGY